MWSLAFPVCGGARPGIASLNTHMPRVFPYGIWEQGHSLVCISSRDRRGNPMKRNAGCPALTVGVAQMWPATVCLHRVAYSELELNSVSLRPPVALWSQLAFKLPEPRVCSVSVPPGAFPKYKCAAVLIILVVRVFGTVTTLFGCTLTEAMVAIGLQPADGAPDSALSILGSPRLFWFCFGHFL